MIQTQSESGTRSHCQPGRHSSARGSLTSAQSYPECIVKFRGIGVEDLGHRLTVLRGVLPNDGKEVEKQELNGNSGLF